MPGSRTKNPPAVETLYHGTAAGLFRRFDMGHALEGDGKVKFGWGVYVTDRVDSALNYARKAQAKKPGSGCFVYKVEVPALAPATDKAAHALLGIPANEAIVQVIACGAPPEEFDVAASPRRPLGDVLTWYGDFARESCSAAFRLVATTSAMRRSSPAS